MKRPLQLTQSKSFTKITALERSVASYPEEGCKDYPLRANLRLRHR